jgi:peptidoglycan/xylan/chitin deacetylase (PgdA/CDA1 family)
MLHRTEPAFAHPRPAPAFLAGLLCLLAALLAPPAPAAAQQTDDQQTAAAGTEGRSAVILMYHRFGEDDYPSTSVTLEQFDAHVAALEAGGHTVVPLSDVVAALRGQRDLPDRAVAITIDDAYSSVYQHAWPILREKGWPFTLFVATRPIDRGTAGYMSWDQIRELAEGGAEIGSQTVSHPHMPTESDARNMRELTDSADRLEAELGARPALFAFPYGEASAAVMAQASQAGYTAAFGQHSGVANPTSPVFYLPRFPINVNYGGIERFRRLIDALPLPVSGVTPADPTLPPPGEPGNPPAFGFTVERIPEGITTLNCFHSDASRMTQLETLGRRVEARFDSPFAVGRTRINCTQLSPNGRWRWFGMQYYVAPE